MQRWTPCKSTAQLFGFDLVVESPKIFGSFSGLQCYSLSWGERYYSIEAEFSHRISIEVSRVYHHHILNLDETSLFSMVAL